VYWEHSGSAISDTRYSDKGSDTRYSAKGSAEGDADTRYSAKGRKREMEICSCKAPPTRDFSIFSNMGGRQILTLWALKWNLPVISKYGY